MATEVEVPLDKGDEIFYLCHPKPHSLEGIQFLKAPKDKKKNISDAEQNNKAESCVNSKLNNATDRLPKSRGRKRLMDHSNSYNAIMISHLNFVQRENQKKKLNSILLKLLDKLPNKSEPLDASNILEHNRRNRKRPGTLNP
ncbi:uncharacterized protein LOC106645437 [Copidosoma floridanum]|uniref:uncharacterized protein LOC106645437 n=1 Tax=Copidosoma floridanum TaxID=29053 RepID=UPI0006C96B9A|nr:uncharacterized protein LOC106645437 [Copidosoma floridanum]